MTTSTSRSRSGTVGDNYDRYRVRHAEIYESVKIISQALEGLPEGPHITPDRKVALPPRHELATSMEALIHHFKLVTEGFRVPAGEAYYPIEGPRGELGLLHPGRRVRQAGAGAHARSQLRPPPGARADGARLLHRRPDRHAGHARPDPGGHRPVSFGHRRAPDISDELRERHGQHRDPVGSLAGRVPRFGHGSRVPGWDDAVDLTKDPAVIPDPATTPVPDDLRREIESAMAKYPDRRSAAIPALHAAQAVHGWCSPEAITQVAAVMRLTPAYLTSVASFYDMFELHAQAHQRRVRVHEHLLLAARRRRVLRGDGRRPPRARTSTCARSSASARATSRRWRRSTASTSARSSIDDAERIVEDLRCRAAGAARKQLRYRRSVRPQSCESEAPIPPRPETRHEARSSSTASTSRA